MVARPLSRRELAVAAPAVHFSFAHRNRLILALPKRDGASLFNPSGFWSDEDGLNPIALHDDINAALTMADDASGQLDPVRERLERYLLRFAADPKRVEALKFNSERWLGFPRRTTPGVMLAGKVQSAEANGNMYEIKLGIGLESDAPIVTVLSAEDPGLSAGDEALALGTIVDNPAEALAGYEGAEPKVVWSGMFVVIRNLDCVRWRSAKKKSQV